MAFSRFIPLCFLLLTLVSVLMLVLSVLSPSPQAFLASPDSASVAATRAKQLIEEGNQTVLLKAKISSYCQALEAISEAIALKPYSSRYLLTWANIRQLLGDWKCESRFPPGDIQGTLALALSISPTDATVNYSAGLVYLWSGDISKARERFSYVVKYDASETTGKELIMRTSLENPDDLSAIIPPRFPHVLRWVSLLESYTPLRDSPERSQATDRALGSLQVRALTTNRRELEEGLISREIFENRLFELSMLAADSESRRVVDNEIARAVFTDPGSTEHHLYKALSGLERAPIVASALSTDRRPLRNPLRSWGSRANFNMLASDTSVGFFIPEEWRPRVILLVGSSSDFTPSIATLKVFVSDDNRAWREWRTDYSVTQGTMFGRPWIALFAKQQERALYWKIRSESHDMQGTFSEELPRLLRVYAEKQKEVLR